MDVSWQHFLLVVVWFFVVVWGFLVKLIFINFERNRSRSWTYPNLYTGNSSVSSIKKWITFPVLASLWPLCFSWNRLYQKLIFFSFLFWHWFICMLQCLVRIFFSLANMKSLLLSIEKDCIKATICSFPLSFRRALSLWQETWVGDLLGHPWMWHHGHNSADPDRAGDGFKVLQLPEGVPAAQWIPSEQKLL